MISSIPNQSNKFAQLAQIWSAFISFPAEQKHMLDVEFILK